MLAILLGIAVRHRPGAGRALPGRDAFGAKPLLELAVALRGASVGLGAIVATGPLLIAGIVGTVLLVIAASDGLCRRLGLPVRLAIRLAERLKIERIPIKHVQWARPSGLTKQSPEFYAGFRVDR
ncbi:hypothetical protein [Methylobacterium sp. Leaf118]|uniref:hypothetical protein n=1 Tax=Methylobacterium sp. Leaf118 TaxID=2876562 RepID=UPI001E4029D8|nr:hypothetical protein [Methylobacterium sp. Leaf118]